MRGRILMTSLALVLAVGSLACSSNKTVGETIDDAVITSKIEAKLAADPEVSSFAVDVDTDQGVVRLSGVVEDRAARREAAKLARNTDGVVRVVNDITIGEMSASDRLDDAGITVKVKSKLTADSDINPFDIDVDTDAGVVTLSGEVDDQSARNKAEMLAKGVDGVLKVRNLLKIEKHDH